MLKCMKCNKEYDENNFKFCPECGEKLINPNGVSMFSQLREDYKNTYGVWEVTTEGDCEGRSTKNLGKFIGHIDDIALFLANQCYYSLRFSRTEEAQAIKLTDQKNEVAVSLDVNSKTWNMKPVDRIATMKELFKERPVEIKHSNFYASFVIAREHKKGSQDMLSCNHKDENGKSLIEYESEYEMRSSDMHCTKCGKSGSREELENDTINP